MSPDLIIGIDAGTSVIKSVAFDLRGRQLAVAAIPNRYESVADGGVEQDMARTWTDAAATLRLLAEKLDDLPARVAAVAVTAQGDGMWLVDAEGEPAAPAWLWLDARAAGIVDEWRAGEVGPKAFAITGSGLNACQMGGQLAWLKRHRPAVLAKATTAFHCKDWLYFKLTGVRATDDTEGVISAGDYRTRGYNDELFRTLGIGELARLLPPIVDGLAQHHPLTVTGAAATGLRAGTPIVLGKIDTVMTGLGGGLYDPARRVGVSIIGSTGMHQRLVTDADALVLHGQAGMTMTFPVPGAWAQMQSNMAGTLNIDWAIDLAAEVLALFGDPRSRNDVLYAIDARVADAKPGAILYHPFISEAGERGPFVDSLARAQLTGLSTRIGYVDLVRAVYEGLGFSARDCYAAMGDLPEEIRVAGGAARSATLRKIIASAVGAPVRTSAREEAGAAGAAMVAAVSIGRYPDIAAACVDWVDPLLGDLDEPDPALQRRYDALFPIYREAYGHMGGVWRGLDRVRREF